MTIGLTLEQGAAALSQVGESTPVSSAGELISEGHGQAISFSEVAKHVTVEDCWVIINVSESLVKWPQVGKVAKMRPSNRALFMM